MTKEAFENAIAVVMAVGGSTNAVLHLLAIAREAQVDLTLDDFERIRRRAPVWCDLKPSGRFVTVDLHRVGGVPQVMKILLNHGLIEGGLPTIDGRTVGEILRDIPDEPPAGARSHSQKRRPDLRSRPSGDFARQLGERGLRGESVGNQTPQNHRPGAGFRFGRKTRWRRFWAIAFAPAMWS